MTCAAPSTERRGERCPEEPHVPRPDFSDYVIHFTKDVAPHSARREMVPGAAAGIAPLSALDRLVRIVEQRVIRAFPMPYTNRPAVCFTECVWASLLDHANHYSRYGIGFNKSFLFSRSGGPAFYVRQDIYRAQVAGSRWDDQVWPFLTPFVPGYASQEHIREFGPGGLSIDYTREREWRVPGELTFELGDIAFVIVAGEEGVNRVAAAGGEILYGKILLMDNYSRIKEFWP